MNRPSTRLERWLLIGALAPLLVALLGYSYGAAWAQRAMARDSAQAEADTLARLSANLVAAPLEFDDPTSLGEVARSVTEASDFEYLLVTRADGSVVLYRGDESLAADRASGLAKEVNVMVGTSPIRSGTHELGRVRLGLTTRRSEDELRRWTINGAVATLIAAAIAVGVVWWLVRIIRRRTERIEWDRRVLQRTGTLARVGGWELELPSGAFTLSEEAAAVVDTTACTPGDVLRLIGTEGRALVRCVDEGTPFDIEVRVPAFGGTRWLRVKGQAERVEGVTRRVVGALQEITEQRKARDEALAASRSKSQFLANTSHEMRTPLNGILGMTSLALETQLTPEQRGYLEAVQLSGRNMLATVNDLLDVSRIESGKFTLEAAPFNLERVLIDATRTLSTQAQAKDVQLIVTIPSAFETWRVGDALRLSQVVINLVGNAVKFTPQGEVEVLVEQGATDDAFTVHVRDTGIGIPADRVDAIFDAFTQSDGSTSRRYGGTGLGLTITRELARLMGGAVSVTSNLGRGSIFHVSLVLPRAPQLRVVNPPPVARALVIDPSPAAARAVRLQLERAGIHVSVASSPEAEAATQFDGELVLVDVNVASGHRAFDSRVVVMVPFGYAAAVPPGLRTLAKPVTARELDAALAPSTHKVLELVARGDRRDPARPLHVLLAEDNAVNAAVARRLIEKAGHRVTHAWNGVEAVEAMHHGSFDLVLMDVQMPELDGLEATRQIRTRERTRTQPPVRIVAMTANAMKSDQEACLAAGMDEFLSKPVEVKRLRALLDECSQGLGRGIEKA